MAQVQSSLEELSLQTSTRNLIIRVSDEQHQLLFAAAQRRGKKLAQWVRPLLLRAALRTMRPLNGSKPVRRKAAA
jgi:uncharacterized protein (DUF1778 family)